MTEIIQSSYSVDQTNAWIRGLISLAWADGHFDPEEQEMINSLLHQEFTEAEKSKALEPISPDELARVLGKDANVAENFLRTAVMVALADGDYSSGEDELLHQYCQALGVKPDALDILRTTLQTLAAAQPTDAHAQPMASGLTPPTASEEHLQVLRPVRDWLDHMDVRDPKIAKLLCKMIPPQCPFERDVKLFGRKLVHIPPLCKLNPLYEQFTGLRFRALSYLADDCGEDISEFI
jgi:tellurite resistance protein